jgi:hypothetical protein
MSKKIYITISHNIRILRLNIPTYQAHAEQLCLNGNQLIVANNYNKHKIAAKIDQIKKLWDELVDFTENNQSKV